MFGFGIGLFIMVFALYYFLADGPTIVEALMHLSPLDDEYERQLLGSFTSVSRAVVLATMLSAAIQGTLAGIGYFFTLEPGSPVFMLTMITMLMALGAVRRLVLGLGPRGVVGLLRAGRFLARHPPGHLRGGDRLAERQRHPAARPARRSNLHPLLALLSVLGGLQLLGRSASWWARSWSPSCRPC